jgi:hypothetical protein
LLQHVRLHCLQQKAAVVQPTGACVNLSIFCYATCVGVYTFLQVLVGLCLQHLSLEWDGGDNGGALVAARAW